jgi:ribose transport system substrate-binding protein
VVSVFTQALCGRFAAVGNAAWTPGTLNFVSDFQSHATMLAWLNAMAKVYPAPQTVGLISGLPTDAESQNLDAAVKIFQKTHHGYTFIPELRTNYTTAGGYSTAQNMLQSHPEVTVIMSDYSDVTVGIARAIDQAGKQGSVHLADYGGSKAILPLLKSGAVGLTLPIYPANGTDTVLKQLQAAWAGKQPPRYTALPLNPVTKANVASFKPGY